MGKRQFKFRAFAAAGAALGVGAMTAGAGSYASADTAPKTVTKHLAVVLVNFTDDKIDSSSEYRSKVENNYFGATGSAAGYYREASDGALTFAPLSGQPKILGPLTINMAAKCDSGAMNTETRKVLTARGVTGFDSLAIVFPNGKAKCNWGGLGQQPGSVTWIPQGSATGLSAVVHELGHNLGLHHLPTVTCTEGTLSNCKDTGFHGSSPMGSGGGQSGLSAPELLYNGWLTADQRVTAPRTGTYTLVPLHAPRSVKGARVLEIPRGSGGAQVTVAYRKNGNTIDTGVGEGVQLHLIAKKDGGNASQLVDPSAGTTGKDDTDLNVGARVTDAQSGVTIETVSATATSATVRITTKDAPAPTPTPTAPSGDDWWTQFWSWLLGTLGGAA
ncbi:Gametolysin peptidase M11 [Actinomadura rubteroloni]|uniref:Gametolysin peptidase M11 n=1 Tax=Actinomadura rubteroloni TaxID=1926885 RepID=A0A2P4UEU2_9ACTN|nr:hypothetical protein [Actinomadura rubteroloni]POM23573.1 Gametolysin peptidase M11 [Actinomadura rubteroloni]